MDVENFVNDVASYDYIHVSKLQFLIMISKYPSRRPHDIQDKEKTAPAAKQQKH